MAQPHDAGPSCPSLVDSCDDDALAAICASAPPADRVSLSLSCTALNRAVGPLDEPERLAGHFTAMVAKPREFPRKRFSYIVREVAQDFRSDLSFQPEAIALLQYAAEQHLQRSFEASAAVQRMRSSSSAHSDEPPMCSHHEHLPAPTLEALQPRGASDPPQGASCDDTRSSAGIAPCGPWTRPAIAVPVSGCAASSFCVLSTNETRHVQFVSGRRDERRTVTATAVAARVVPASQHPYLAAEDATDDETDADYEPPPEPAAGGEAWACLRCTLHNSAAASFCAACRGGRPDERSPVTPSATASAEDGAGASMSEVVGDASMAEAEGEGGSAGDEAGSEGESDGEASSDGESVDYSCDSDESSSDEDNEWWDHVESAETRRAMDEEEAAARVVYPLLRTAIARDRTAWRAERAAAEAGPSEGGGGDDDDGGSGSGGDGDGSGSDYAEQPCETSEWSSLYSSSDDGRDPMDSENRYMEHRKRCRAIRRDRAAACFALTCPACRKVHYD